MQLHPIREVRSFSGFAYSTNLSAHQNSEWWQSNSTIHRARIAGPWSQSALSHSCQKSMRSIRDSECCRLSSRSGMVGTLTFGFLLRLTVTISHGASESLRAHPVANGHPLGDCPGVLAQVSSTPRCLLGLSRILRALVFEVTLNLPAHCLVTLSLAPLSPFGSVRTEFLCSFRAHALCPQR
jgi:hypothetical protein